MRRSLAAAVTAVSLYVLSPSAQSSSGPKGPLPPILTATVHVNVLLIGFEPRTLSDVPDAPHEYQAIYTDVLPLFYARKSDPVVRQKTNQFLDPPKYFFADQHLDYDYHTHYAPAALEDRFFSYLQRVGQPGPRTPWQTRYNDQQSNVVEIPEQVLHISGEKIEGWLLRELKAIPGLNADGYTVVFINWFGRPDFQFHVYHGEGLDVDTGVDARSDVFSPGIAWGGTHGRLWFYDMSAGPDGPTSNWNVDDIEVAGGFLPYLPDGFVDYRIPPIWEFRQDLPAWLVGDATLVAAEFAYYVVHFLFTPSPIYDPLHSVPEPGRGRVLRLNYFDGDPSVPSWQILKPRKVERDVQDLQPYIPLEATLAERPLAGPDLTAFQVFIWSWANVVFAPGCWEQYGHPVWEMYCYSKDNEAVFAVPNNPGDWVIPAMLYNITNDARASLPPAVIGFADFDPTGQPYELFVQSYPGYRQNPVFGQGMTAVVDHEAGHHVGLSHEHDGWDGEILAEIGAFFAKFVFAFDECHCAMGYVHEAAGFGQFERDNIDRNLAARAYAETLRLIGSDDDFAAVEPRLREARASFMQMDWRSAVQGAVDAYNWATRRAGHLTRRRQLQTTEAGQDHRRHPGVVDPPSPHPDDNLEVRQLRRDQGSQLRTLAANDRWHPPSIVARANADPDVRAYLERLHVGR